MESARCRAFVASAETGSFTAAGKMLDYTPSGVSQLVRAFENELGLTLLSRKNRGVTLTRDGERLYPQVVEYINRENSMMKVADDIAELATGTVTIASFSSIAANYLPSILKGFSSKYENIELRIIEAAKYKIEELISENTADIAFASELDRLSCDFVPFTEDRIMAVLPKGHKYAEAESFPLAECENEDLIMPAKGNDIDVLRILKDNGVDFNIKFSTMEDITAAHLVSAGLGISITNESAVDPARNGEYVLVPVEPLSTVTFGISVMSMDSVSPAVRKFLSYASHKLTDSGK